MQHPDTPMMPIAAASAVVIRDGEALMVKRGRAPNKDLWSFPGGKIEPGETVAQAALRELVEETGVRAEARELIRVLDIIARDDAQLQYHYLLVVMRCDWLGGDPVAADDAADARWIPLWQLREGHYPLTDTVLPILEQLDAC
ncbi:hypothetical protein GCM10011348_40510 [Marinobacterium nitratireducens]|uniref:Nudix hydrolase domain-containing protein n=1 Tax=Marinobacterium nitratireducens TaxID=518897 RepID=A0A918DY07_9GAMM|nr:NUDIX hydrolase [Marinobacterium nitratireducens]GGO87395.1 hypothetical protein GCM10011348_40510 [Marinobacterium nitratireducens]